jgi:hypothetical protein
MTTARPINVKFDLASEIARGQQVVASLPGVLQSVIVGSAAYLPTANDVDFLLLIGGSESPTDYVERLEADGWEQCGEYEGDESIWNATRLGNLNLLVTNNRQFYDGFKRALEVCKALRLTSRDDRVAVHQIVRDGLTAADVVTTAIEAEASAHFDRLIKEMTE